MKNISKIASEIILATMSKSKFISEIKKLEREMNKKPSNLSSWDINAIENYYNSLMEMKELDG